MATRVKDAAFYVELYAAITAKAGIGRVLESELPAGVTAQLRTDGEHDYIFLQNFSGTEASVTLDGLVYTDLESGEAAPEVVALPVNGLVMLKRKVAQK